jgi:hypothetical protein
MDFAWNTAFSQETAQMTAGRFFPAMPDLHITAIRISGNHATGTGPARGGGAVYAVRQGLLRELPHSANTADTSGGAFYRSLISGSSPVLSSLLWNHQARAEFVPYGENGQERHASPAPIHGKRDCVIYNNLVTGFSGNSGTVYTIR